MRHVIVASCVHGCVGAFYVLRARTGKQILHIKSFKSVDTICGYPTLSPPSS
jgi:hypothetical protein